MRFGRNGYDWVQSGITGYDWGRVGGYDDRTSLPHTAVLRHIFFCDAISIDFSQVKLNGFSHFAIVGKSHGGQDGEWAGCGLVEGRVVVGGWGYSPDTPVVQV